MLYKMPKLVFPVVIPNIRLDLGAEMYEIRLTVSTGGRKSDSALGKIIEVEFLAVLRPDSVPPLSDRSE